MRFAFLLQKICLKKSLVRVRDIKVDIKRQRLVVGGTGLSAVLFNLHSFPMCVSIVCSREEFKLKLSLIVYMSLH